MDSIYLKTLFVEFSNKIKSSLKYNERISGEIKDTNQQVFEWAGKLHEKFEALNSFQDSRHRTPSAGDFAIEHKLDQEVSIEPTDLKKIEKEIIDSSEQINLLFEKTQNDAQFLVQTLQSIQDMVNKIYDKYQELFDDM